MRGWRWWSWGRWHWDWWEWVGGGGAGTGGSGAGGAAGAGQGKELQGVGHLGQVADPVDAVRGGQCLPPSVRGGQGAGVRRHQGPAAGRPARGQHHHRDPPLARRGQHRAQPPRLPDGLQDQGQHPGLRQAQRVLGILGRRGDQLLAGGHRDREAQPPAGTQQRGEHRPRVRDQRDRPGGERVRLDVTHRAQAVGHVDKAHAARPAHRHARRTGRGGQPGPQGRLYLAERLARRPGRWLGRRLAGQFVRAAEQHRRTVAPVGRQGQLLLHGRVRDGQQDQVHRPGQVGQGGVAGPAGDPFVTRVDQVDLRPRRAPGHLADHPLAQAARPRAGPDQGHRARFEHGGQRGPVRHAGSRETRSRETGSRRGGSDVAHVLSPARRRGGGRCPGGALMGSVAEK